MAVRDILERIEQVTAAVNGAAQRPKEPGTERWLEKAIGITISGLSVLLALCGARMGAERAELTRALLDQSRARAEFHAQDVKHRMAVVSLQQVRATLPGASGDPARRREVLRLAGTVERYLEESGLALTWSLSFDPLVDARVRGEEGLDSAQLCLQIGMVLATAALLMQRRGLWIAAVALGLAALALIGRTESSTGRRVQEAMHGIDRTFKSYTAARQRDRTTDAEMVLLADVRNWAASPRADGL